MKAIGITTTYDGTEHAYLRGHKVRIVAVLKNALRADYDPDHDGQHITNEHDLERAGGVTADDRVEVQPWLEAEGALQLRVERPARHRPRVLREPEALTT